MSIKPHNDGLNATEMIIQFDPLTAQIRYRRLIPWCLIGLGVLLLLVASQVLAGHKPGELEMIRHQAGQGDPNAQLLYGLSYLEGRYHSKPNSRIAAYWLLRAARDGQNYAALEMGKLFAHGNGVIKDPVQAVYWWTKAAEGGIPEAQYQLGKAYHDGFGVDNNPKKSIHWMTLSAEHGNHKAEYELGKMYHEGYATAKDKILAQDWLSRAARSGNSAAINFLAVINKVLKYTTLVYQQSAGILEEKAVHGDSGAQYELGLRYESGAWDVNKNDKKAIHWLTEAANNGNLNAMSSLVDIYTRGDLGMKKRPDLVSYWIKQAKKHR